MQIIFKTPGGDTYSGELEDGKLTDIKKLDTPPPSRGGGGTVPDESETKPEEQPNSKDSKNGAGANDTMSKQDKVFIEQLKAVLVNNRARKQLRHRTKGLLDPRAFVKTQVDSPSVFRQNNRKDSQRNYSVVLLVDESGSMADSKAKLAQELTQSMTASLEQVGGVEVAVLGFSGNRIVEHKRFDNTGHNSLCCISSFSGNDYHCSTGSRIRGMRSSDCENADLIAMEYALSYLTDKHSPDSKQVFIMLSDGAPCNSASRITVIDSDLRSSTFVGKFTEGVSGNTRDINNMHRLLGRFPDITSFGLGMLRGGQQVPKHVVVQDLSQTKRVLLNFLRATIS